VWHVLTRDHTVLPATHTFIRRWNEPYMSIRAVPNMGFSVFGGIPISSLHYSAEYEYYSKFNI